jgi:mono/diheme cytochrome c family protein
MPALRDGRPPTIVMRTPVPVNCVTLAASTIATSALVFSIVCVSAQQGPAPAAKAPPPPEASVNDIDGETLFATVCGWCHESGGRTAGKGPKLAGTTRSDDFILNRIRNGKPGAMPAFGGSFSEGQIVAILAYIRTLEDTP